MEDVFYVCACSNEANGGIYVYRTTSAGSLIQIQFQPLAGTNYLCFSPDRRFLYATINGVKHEGGAAALQIRPDGTLSLLNTMDSGGGAACHVTCSPNGKFLYCANYLTGNFAEFALSDGGSILKRTKLVQHTGCGPRADRQEAAHTHCTVFAPDGKYLCVNDLGTDSVMIYPFDPEQGISETAHVWKADPGEGPRHILFDKSGRYAYVINELGNSVTTLSYCNGAFQRLGCFSTLPDNCATKTKAAAIRFSPDEKYLYASNRGFDSIACFRVTAPGKLELFDIVSSFGSSPRDINYLPGTDIFAAANEFSDVICFYDADPVTGKLEYREGCDLKGLPRPLCLLY